MVWKYKTPGIPDSQFSKREGVPITKEEARTIQISKARLREGDSVYDIGCGSGSITVEAAIQVGESGKILSVANRADQDMLLDPVLIFRGPCLGFLQFQGSQLVRLCIFRFWHRLGFFLFEFCQLNYKRGFFQPRLKSLSACAVF